MLGRFPEWLKNGMRIETNHMIVAVAGRQGGLEKDRVMNKHHPRVHTPRIETKQVGIELPGAAGQSRINVQVRVLVPRKRNFPHRHERVVVQNVYGVRGVLRPNVPNTFSQQMLLKSIASFSRDDKGKGGLGHIDKGKGSLGHIY